METLNIEVQCPFDSLFGIFGSHVSTGMAAKAPGCISVQLEAMPIQKRHLGHEVASLATLTVSFGRDAAVGVFSSWLYDKLKGSKSPRVVINRRVVELTPDGIIRVLEETIETESEDRSESLRAPDG